jgi:hypothetical protein
MGGASSGLPGVDLLVHCDYTTSVCRFGRCNIDLGELDQDRDRRTIDWAAIFVGSHYVNLYRLAFDIYGLKGRSIFQLSVVPPVVSGGSGAPQRAVEVMNSF